MPAEEMTQIRVVGSILPTEPDFGARKVAETLRAALDGLGEDPREIARSLTERGMSLGRYIAETVRPFGPPWIIEADPAQFEQPTDVRVQPNIIMVEALARDLPRRVYVTVRPSISLRLFMLLVEEDTEYFPEYRDLIANEPALGLLWS